MNPQIYQALVKLFDKHRIVFWYDSKQELREDFAAIEIADVEKLEIANNEFWLKYHLLHEKPKQKFLLYKEDAAPALLDNWLLDIQLAHTEFKTDQASIWLADLELGIEFSSLMTDHSDFFTAEKRRSALKLLHQKDFTLNQVRLAMLAVCAETEMRLDAVLEQLLKELAAGKNTSWRLIERSNLAEYVWQQLGVFFNYASAEPSIKDFTLELFKSCFARGLNKEAALNSEALVFLRRFKDNRQLEQSFRQLAAEYTEILAIQQQLEKTDFRQLIQLDYFELIDQKIISDLVKAVLKRTVNNTEVSQWIRSRRLGFWYADYQHLYQAIEYAAAFLQTLDAVNLNLATLSEAVEKYSKSWFKLDQYYRKFIYHLSNASRGASLMQALANQIENFYTQQFLLPLNNEFQEKVDAISQWEAAPVIQQNQFFNHWVQPFLTRNHKVIVIISDALRYEIGQELLSNIRQEDRFSAVIEPCLAMLPSYTQLGMAALLPHKTLSFADTTSSGVLVDGQSSQGTANRSKLLAKALDNRGTAIKAEELLQMNLETSRELLKANDVIYVYHNRIDHTGDKIQSEGQAFEVAEKTLDDLLVLVKKLTNANANNILITADHGFIYQHQELQESDFSNLELEGESLLFKSRRFVLGKNLQPQQGLRHFTSAELGLTGDIEVQLPKSINRLRLQGSGSRFVHGGASLQEVVIPVLSVNKKRQSDTSQVEVEILRGNVNTITTNQLAVTFYQKQPVTDKIQPRYLRVGIYNKQGELISDSQELAFDFTASSSRDREQRLGLILARNADSANGQEVTLRLDEKVAGTSHYKEYTSIKYLFQRSFTSDFDF